MDRDYHFSGEYHNTATTGFSNNLANKIQGNRSSTNDFDYDFYNDVPSGENLWNDDYNLGQPVFHTKIDAFDSTNPNQHENQDVMLATLKTVRDDHFAPDNMVPSVDNYPHDSQDVHGQDLDKWLEPWNSAFNETVPNSVSTIYPATAQNSSQYAGWNDHNQLTQEVPKKHELDVYLSVNFQQETVPDSCTFHSVALNVDLEYGDNYLFPSNNPSDYRPPLSTVDYGYPEPDQFLAPELSKEYSEPIPEDPYYHPNSYCQDHFVERNNVYEENLETYEVETIHSQPVVAPNKLMSKKLETKQEKLERDRRNSEKYRYRMLKNRRRLLVIYNIQKRWLKPMYNIPYHIRRELIEIGQIDSKNWRQKKGKTTTNSRSDQCEETRQQNENVKKCRNKQDEASRVVYNSIKNIVEYLKNGKVLTGGKIRTLNDVLDEEVLLARQRMNGYPNFPSDDDLEGMKHLLPAGCSSESFMDELRNTYNIKK